METRWTHVTSEDLASLREAANGVCVIPMGCVEKHGPHLPLGTDAMEAESLAYAASQKETVCLFPTYVFGDYCTGAPTAPDGCVTIPLELEMQLLEIYCEQISRSGFKKIMVYNAHGGNKPWLSAFLRKLANKKRDYVLSVANCGANDAKEIGTALLERGRGIYPELTKEDEDYLMKYVSEKQTDGHAGLGETALMMAIAPETVHMERLGTESGLSTHEADYLKAAGIQIMNHGWDVNFPNSYAGHDPVGCNERIAKLCFSLAVNRLAKALKAYKEDTNLLRWLDEMQKGW